jgi:FkbH-like protein
MPDVGLDYAALIKVAKKLEPTPEGKGLRIALVGDSATQQLAAILRALFHRRKAPVHVYEAGFDTIDLEIQNPESELYRFNPDVVVILATTTPLKKRFFAYRGPKSGFVSDTVERFKGLWDLLAERTKALVVQSNFVVPYERIFGNFDHKVEGSLHDAVATINRRLSEESRAYPNVFLNDVDYLASWVGRRSWFDEKLWALAKSPCALDHLPLLAKNILDVVLASQGTVAKCIVVDLDNTMWGGIIGDDGVDGIRVGHHGDGEAFVAFQEYLFELSKRGLILAVCSKNNHETALLPFRQRHEMVLREEHFVMFVANWNNKADNITLIKETLNIGYDAMVFLDDNPFERNLVREMLPDVIVPELPEDPADYVKAISELNLFETNAVSALDEQRTAMYRQAAEREMSKAKFTDVADYLRSLEMVVDLRRFEPENLARIAQLAQRSNQFNLATRRYSQADCEAFMKDTETYVPLSISLADKFGDYGIISVVVSKVAGTRLHIDELFMSCRVLQRGVEEYVMNWLVQLARQRGITEIAGIYRPTAKNSMVKEFYARFGFENRGGDPDVNWLLDVSKYEPRVAHMTPAPSSLKAPSSLRAP